MLKQHALADRRTINAEAEILLSSYFDDNKGLNHEQARAKQRSEALAVKAHAVDEGRRLGVLPEPEVVPVDD